MFTGVRLGGLVFLGCGRTQIRFIVAESKREWNIDEFACFFREERKKKFTQKKVSLARVARAEIRVSEEKRSVVRRKKITTGSMNILF